MQENEFEKQVQQKMGELKLVPSDAVWQKIEPQIKKEKRRRWILLVLPLLVAALYGTYKLTEQPGEQEKHLQTITTGEKNNTGKASPPVVDTIKNITTAKVPAITIDRKSNSPDTKNSQVQGLGPVIRKPLISQKIRSSLTGNGDQPTDLAADNQYKNGKRTIRENEKINININQPAQEKLVNTESNRENIITQENASPKEKTLAIKDSTEKSASKTINETIATPIEMAKRSNRKYPWNFGISFAAGASGVNGVGGIANALLGNEDKSVSYASSASLPPASQISYIRSPIRPSVALIAGASAEKQLSRRIIFTTGFNYKLFTTKNNVGRDSLAFYYSDSDVSEHHNLFHYLELPAGIKWQLTTGKQIPLFWNVGTSVSVLAGSNALQYNNSTHLYYHDNSLLNKIQLGISTGLELALISKQRSTLLLGPVFNYSISKIAVEGYNNHHFTFIGIRSQYFFSKK